MYICGYQKLLMIRIVITLVLLLGYTGLLSAQELYMPRNIKKAYAKHTRARNGQPGERYWQNKGRYDIQLKLNAPSGVVYGRESIRYINNSPDTLRKIVIACFATCIRRTRPAPGMSAGTF
jgi:hypothetical protein